MPEQKREPIGPAAGRWARDSHAAAEFDLDELRSRMDAAATTTDHSELNRAIRDPSPMVRSDATINPNLTRREHLRLARDKDLTVRLAAACRTMPGGADLAAQDPSPLVRIRALTGYGLSAAAFDELDRDPEVLRILARISA